MALKDGQASIAITLKVKARLESKKHLYHKRNMSDTINELIDRAEKAGKQGKEAV